MTIGENIKILRQKNNLTQEDLANIAGVTNKAVSSWENNKKLPRMGAIQKMADYFGIKKSDIIEIETNSVQNLTDTVIIDKTTKEDIDESDEQNNTKELRKEVSLIEQIEQKHGKKASEAFDLYLQLDSDDQGEIRGEMKHMLKSEKYSVQKGQSNEKVM